MSQQALVVVFAFATSLPEAVCSAFSREMVSDVSVTYLLIPFTIRTHEAVPDSKQRFDQNSYTVTDLDEDRPSHPRPGRFSYFRLYTLLLGVFFLSRGNVYSRQRFFISFGPFCCIKCDEELSFFRQSSNQRQSTVWITSGHQSSCSNLRS